MIDLVYFGYPHESHSEVSEKEFKRDIVKVFPNVKLDDAYDEIKGYRQKVTLSTLYRYQHRQVSK